MIRPGLAFGNTMLPDTLGMDRSLTSLPVVNAAIGGVEEER